VIESSHPNGHFYSPVTDPRDLAGRMSQLWPQRPEVLGIDFNDAMHRHVLCEVFPRYLDAYDYPDELPAASGAARFFSANGQFEWFDACTLFALLREWRPKRLIEVGCGFSSLLIADINRRYLGGSLDVTCIEPYPRPFLTAGVPGISRLVQAKVQDVPLEMFGMLESGDILFVDSSHVVKTGSDVNFLYFEVIPRLRSGVRVHIHDIFLPQEYPKEWVLGENRSWNEQYLLRALLMFNSQFRVLFGTAYAYWRWPDLVDRAMAVAGRRSLLGGSMWIQRASVSD
jgi:methyltransferase family protein